MEHYNPVRYLQWGMQGQEPQEPTGGAMNPADELAREEGKKKFLGRGHNVQRPRGMKEVDSMKRLREVQSVRGEW